MFVRVPSRLARQFELPTSFPVLLPSDKPPSGDVQFAIRLKDNYTCGKAILLNERWYVRNALLRARRVIVLECSDKDPLLVLSSFGDTDIEPTFNFVPLPTLDFEGDIPTPKIHELAVQLLRQPPPTHLIRNYPMPKYKMYHSVPTPDNQISKFVRENFKDLSCVVMPKEALLTDNFLPRMASVYVRKTHSTTDVVTNLQQHPQFPYIHMSSKNHIRILTSDGITDPILQILKTTPGVSYITIDAVGSKKHFTSISATSDDADSKAESFRRYNATTLKIMRVDGNAITPEVGKLLVNALKLDLLEVRDGAVLMKAASTDICANMHEMRLKDAYKVCWLGAPPEGPI